MGFGQIDLSLSLDGQEFGGETDVSLRLGGEEEIKCDDDAGTPFIEKAAEKSQEKKALPQSSTAQKMAAAVKLVKQQQSQKVKEQTVIEG